MARRLSFPTPTRARLRRGVWLVAAIGCAVAFAPEGPTVSAANGDPAAPAGPCRIESVVFAIDRDDTLTVSSERLPAPAWSLSLRRVASSAGIAEEDALVESSFACDPRGVEPRLEVRPGSRDARTVSLEFALSGGLIPKVSDDGRTILYGGRDGVAALVSRDLQAVDAAGREVGARWEIATTAGGVLLRLLLATEDHDPPVRVTYRLAPRKSARGAGAVLAVASPPAAAAPPANDTCDGVEILSGAGPFPLFSSVVDLAEATDAGDPPAPACQADVSHGVWFRFTPLLDGDYSFSVCSEAPTGTTTEDTVLALYTEDAPCAAPGPIGGACSDDDCGAAGLQSRLDGVALTGGRTYAVLVWTYGTMTPPPGSSAVQLRVDRLPPVAPPPPNDRCENAEVIPPAGPFPLLTSIVDDISGATAAGDPPLPSCQPNVSRSVWYRFVPAIGGRYVFSACADAPTATTVHDTVVAVYASGVACAGGVELAGGCDDDGCAGEPAQSRTAPLDLAAGTAYDIVVWHYGTAGPVPGSTAVQLRVEQVAAPVNDTCAVPGILALDHPSAGSTTAAADDTRLPAGAGCYQGPGQTPSTASGRDVAYRFTAAESGRYSFRVTPQATGNLVLYAAPGCPASASPATVTDCLGAANRSATQPEEVDCLALAAGATVFLFVDEETATPGIPFAIEANRCAPENEPNGATSSAGALACFVEGSIAPAGDADFFALGTPPALSRVFAIVDGAAAGSADFDLRVTTGADTLEYDDFNNDAAYGTNAPNVAGTPLTGSAGFLRVSHYSAQAQSQPYRLCATVRPPASQAAAENEPNDAPAVATPAPGGYVSGALASAADVDLFAFDAAAGDLVQIGLDLDPHRDGTPFNGSLALLDGNGASLVVVNDASSASSTLSGTGSLAASVPFSPAEALLYRIRSSGTYLARVAFASGVPGDYLLSVARHPPGGPFDADGDGIADPEDCAPADPGAWDPPGEATGLRFAAGSDAMLQWSPPSAPGGTTMRYDLLRGLRKDDWQSAVCLLTDTTDTTAIDASIPASAFFYLVRSRNACGQNAGTGSGGAPRLLPACP